jgi:hypothetical protein
VAIRVVRLARQRGYVLFGIEWDFDRDDRMVSIHLWPITLEWYKDLTTK